MNVREARHRRGLTLADLAHRARTWPQTVCAIEHGLVPGATLRRRLAKALNLRQEDLWPDVGASRRRPN